MPERSITDIGKYKILGVVGEGAMGVVYRATDPALNRTVAIKVMSEAIARQQDLRDRFLHEAQAAGSMQHPNIVSIYDLGEMEGHLYIAMEFVEGMDLEKVIANREPLTLQAKLDIIIDVLAGLAYAHKRGIVHRDIKPANIRIAEDGRAKIMDFGVAHLSSSTLTRTGMVVGTPAYMAPEQVTGTHTTAATDLFAVGAVLYELLTGLKAFAAPTLQSLFFKIVTEPPVSMLALLPGLPEELNQIMEKALEKNPADRYKSALDMANDLTKVRATLSGAQHPGTVSLTATVAHAIAEKQRVTARTRQLASAGGLLAVAAVTAIWFASSRSAPLTGSASGGTSGPAAPALSSGAPGSVPTTPQRTSAEQPLPSMSDAGAPLRPPAANSIRKPSPDVIPQKPKKVAAPSRPEAAPRKTAANVEPPSVREQPAPAPGVVARVVAPPATPVPAPPPAPAPAPAPAPPAAPAAPAAPSREGVTATVEDYAQAIESRDIAAVRRVYPNLTSAQQAGLEDFFKRARGIKVTFRINALEMSGTSAEARLVGTYDYVDADGRSQREPVSLHASFKHNGSVWRLVSVGQ